MALAKPLIEEANYLRAEAVLAATHQGALSLDDVLTRRLRVSLDVPDHGEEAARSAAPLLAGVLGWSDQRTADEVAGFDADMAWAG